MKMQLQERFPDVKSEKFSIITNGFDPEDFKDVTPYKYEKNFVILHYGTLFRWRKPDNIFIALKNLISKNKDFGEDVSAVFMGIFHNDTLECVKKFDLEPYVKIIDYKPYYESLQYLKGADLLLLITGELSFNRNMLTTKVFDYIGANKPILAITENGALKNLIEEYSLGKSIQFDDIEGIENAIFEFYLDFKLKKDNYKPKDCSVFERKFITKQLSEVLDGLI
jgi:glycosyltransferase involved in cell wall biosynthesis